MSSFSVYSGEAMPLEGSTIVDSRVPAMPALHVNQSCTIRTFSRISRFLLATLLQENQYTRDRGLKDARENYCWLLFWSSTIAVAQEYDSNRLSVGRQSVTDSEHPLLIQNIVAVSFIGTSVSRTRKSLSSRCSGNSRTRSTSERSSRCPQRYGLVFFCGMVLRCYP